MEVVNTESDEISINCDITLVDGASDGEVVNIICIFVLCW